MPTLACTPFLDVTDVTESTCGCSLDDIDVTVIEDWIDMASDIIFHLTGGMVTGLCTRTVRPMTSDQGCYPLTADYGVWGPDYQSLLGGLKPVILRGPNATVVGVKIDGVALDPTNYAIVNGIYLIRTDGLTWPTYNNLALRDTEEGTWALTVTFGHAPDLLTQQAALELVCDLARTDGLLRQYRFPPGVVAASIQGASVVVAEDGGTNLPSVTKLVSMYQPAGGVYSPEIVSPYRLMEVAYS